METVIETHAFQAAAKAGRMTEAELNAAITLIATNPLAGDVIVGSGGCRKVRVAGRGFGKSGGYRIVTYYVTSRGVFLVYLLSKGDRQNFSDAEIAQMATFSAQIRRIK